MNQLLVVALGGAIGAASRHLVNIFILNFTVTSFPWGTFAVNVIGCFLMGIIVELLVLRGSTSQELRLFLATGVLGGFTTFSAFSLDTALLLEREEMLLTALYVFGSVSLSIGALFLGLMIARSMLS
jgi:CrcB protein